MALGPFHRVESRAFPNDDDIGYAEMHPHNMDQSLAKGDSQYESHQPVSTGNYVGATLQGLSSRRRR